MSLVQEGRWYARSPWDPCDLCGSEWISFRRPKRGSRRILDFEFIGAKCALATRSSVRLVFLASLVEEREREDA